MDQLDPKHDEQPSSTRTIRGGPNDGRLVRGADTRSGASRRCWLSVAITLVVQAAGVIWIVRDTQCNTAASGATVYVLARKSVV